MCDRLVFRDVDVSKRAVKADAETGFDASGMMSSTWTYGLEDEICFIVQCRLLMGFPGKLIVCNVCFETCDH